MYSMHWRAYRVGCHRLHFLRKSGLKLRLIRVKKHCSYPRPNDTIMYSVYYILNSKAASAT